MAVDLGYSGAVYIGANKIAELNRWSGQFEAGQEEKQSFGSDHKERVYTLKDASGSFSGNGDDADTTGQNALISQFLTGGTPAAVFLYLYRDASNSKGYYGEALVTPSIDVDTSALQTFDCAWTAADAWYQNIG